MINSAPNIVLSTISLMHFLTENHSSFTADVEEEGGGGGSEKDLRGLFTLIYMPRCGYILLKLTYILIL